MKEFVYFIASELGPIKIGRAVNIKNRLQGLQCSSPHKLSVLGLISGDPGLEGILHKQFASLRESGEWFRRDSSLLSYIQENAREFNADLEREMKHYEAIAREEKNGWRRDWEIERQKIKYRDELEIVVARAVADLEEKLINEIVKTTSRWQAENLARWVDATMDAQKFLREISAYLAKKGIHGNMDNLWKQFRRVVDSALGTKWQDSQHILSGDEYPDPETFAWSTKAKMRAELRGVIVNRELRQLIEDLAAKACPEETLDEEEDDVG